MSDLPLVLDEPLASRLLAALDAEQKIVRALEALGPLAHRDVALIGGGPARTALLGEAGARVEPAEWQDGAVLPLARESVDVVVGLWSAFRGVDPAELAEADRVLRPGGRLLVVHDYGRDDVSRLRGDLPEYGEWSRRDGPFLRAGFKIRVIHCWWTFGDEADLAAFLATAFGAPGEALSATLRRPRLSYNVAIYHRTRSAGAQTPSAEASSTVA